MANQRSTQSAESENAEQDSAPTSRRVTSLAHDAIDNASGKAEEVERKLRAEASRLAEKSGEAAAEAKKQLDDKLDRLDKFVRERPFAAAGIAFAAGVVGALLMKRS